MIGQTPSFFAPLVDKVERKAAAVNMNMRGRRRPGMGTITQCTYMPSYMPYRTESFSPYRNVPEWCAHRFINSGYVPLENCCSQIFNDTCADPCGEALDMGRRDIREIHSRARYTECAGCVMCVGGVYKGLYMLNIMRHANRLSRDLKGRMTGINRMCDMINADCQRMSNTVGNRMNPSAAWKCAQKD